MPDIPKKYVCGSPQTRNELLDSITTLMRQNASLGRKLADSNIKLQKAEDKNRLVERLTDEYPDVKVSYAAFEKQLQKWSTWDILKGTE